MARRRSTSPQDEVSVLLDARRRCCVCFGLHRKDEPKRGQIAHLDHDASNNAPDNLVFLCLEHHDEYDSRTSQSKGLTRSEIQRFREELKEHNARVALSDTKGTTRERTISDVLEPFERRENWITVFGRSRRPYSDSHSSHARWTLRFASTFDEPVLPGLFVADPARYVFRCGNYHYQIDLESWEKKSFDLSKIDPFYDKPDKWLAARGGERVYSTGAAIYILVINAETFEVSDPEFLYEHREDVAHIAYDANSDRVMSCGNKGEILIWDWPNRRVLHRVQSVVDNAVGASFSHLDGRIIVTDNQGNFEVLNPIHGRSLIRGKAQIRGKGSHVSLSVDGNYFVGSDATDRWDVLDVVTLGPVEIREWDSIWVSNCVASEKMCSVFKSASGLLWVLEKRTDEQYTMDLLPPVSRRASTMAISKNGLVIAQVLEAKEVRIWERERTG